MVVPTFPSSVSSCVFSLLHLFPSLYTLYVYTMCVYSVCVLGNLLLTFQVNDFSDFLCMGRSKSLGSLKLIL